MIRNINTISSRPLSDNYSISYEVPTTTKILNRVFFDANELSAPNVYAFRSVILKSGTTNSYVFRLYWNTTLSTTGATLLASYELPATNIRYISINRKIFFDTSTTAQIMNPSYSASTTDIGDFPTTLSSVSVSNWLSTAGYFFISCDASPSGVDSIKGLYLSIEV